MNSRRVPPTPTDPTEPVKARHQQLTEQARQAKNPAELSPQAEAFILEIRRLGSQVAPGSGRELLRSLASYWATFVYQHSVTGVYPSTELEPYLGPAVPPVKEAVPPAGRRVSPLVWGVIVVACVGLAAILVFVSILRPLISKATPTAPPTSTRSVTVPLATNTPDKPPVGPDVDLTQTALASTPPTSIEETPSPPPTIGPQPTETLQPMGQAGIGVQMTNLSEGQEVSSFETVNIQYDNLQPGWTVYLLVQPVNGQGLFFPLKDSLVVQDSSGVWTVSVPFTNWTGDQYNITPVVAISEQARNELSRAASDGFAQLPEGVIPFPQVITVRHAASDLVAGERLIYSSYSRETSKLEIVTANLDGSDERRISSAPNLNKLYPALSPSGRQIAFVGRELAPTGEVSESLWLVDTNGENPVPLLQTPGYRYDPPAWFPDESYLAFSAIQDASGAQTRAAWKVYLYDMKNQTLSSLENLPPNARNPVWARDSDTFYFSADSKETGTRAIFRSTRQNSQIEVLFDGPDNEDEPSLSPDEQQLAFISTQITSDLRGGAPLTTLWIYIVADQRPIDMFSDIAGYHHPTWNTNSDTLFFESNAKESYGIWVYPLVSGDLHQITFGVADRWPSVGTISIYLPSRVSSP